MKLKWSTLELRNQEFEAAEKQFAAYSNGAYIKKGVNYYYDAATRQNKYFTHSFLKTSMGIIALPDSRQDHKTDTVLGRGSFGKVKRCEKKDGTKIALKVNSENTSVTDKEVAIMQYLGVGGEKIPHLNEAKAGYAYIPMTYLGRDNLTSTLKNNKLGIEQKNNIALKFLGELFRLHEGKADEYANYPIAHGDIKPDNIIVSKDLSKVHLIDFGLSTNLNEGYPYGVGGTPHYLHCGLLGAYMGNPIGAPTRALVDGFAACRVLWVSQVALGLDLKNRRPGNFDMSSIPTIYKANELPPHLRNLIDTSNGCLSPDFSMELLFSALILHSLNLRDESTEYAALTRSRFLQKALINVYRTQGSIEAEVYWQLKSNLDLQYSIYIAAENRQNFTPAMIKAFISVSKVGAQLYGNGQLTPFAVAIQNSPELQQAINVSGQKITLSMASAFAYAVDVGIRLCDNGKLTNFAVAIQNSPDLQSTIITMGELGYKFDFRLAQALTFASNVGIEVFKDGQFTEHGLSIYTDPNKIADILKAYNGNLQNRDKQTERIYTLFNKAPSQAMQGTVTTENHVINPTDSSAQASGSSPEIVITAQEIGGFLDWLMDLSDKTLLESWYNDGLSLDKLNELSAIGNTQINPFINKLINTQQRESKNITSQLLEKYEAPAVPPIVNQSISTQRPLVKEEPVKEVVPSQDILITPEEMGVFINYLAEMGDDSPYLELWYNQEVGLSLIQLRDLHSRANNSSIKSIIGKLIAVCEQEKLITISDDWVTKKDEVNMPMREEQKNKIHFAELVLNNASDHELNQQLAYMDIKGVKAQNGLLLDMNGADSDRIKLLTRGDGTCGLRALLVGGLTHAVQTGDAQVLDKLLVACNGLYDSTDPKYAELQKTLQGQEENIKQYLAAIKNGKKSIKDILKQACIDGHQGCLPDNPLNNALVATVLYAGEEGKAQSEIGQKFVGIGDINLIHENQVDTFLNPSKRGSYSVFEVLLCSEVLGTKTTAVDQYDVCNNNSEGELKGNIKIAGAEGHYTFEVSDIIDQNLDITMHIKNVQQPASPAAPQPASPLPLKAMPIPKAKFSSKASAQKHSVRDESSEQGRDKSPENNMVQNKPLKNGDIGYTYEDLMSFAVRVSSNSNYKKIVEEYLLENGLNINQLELLDLNFGNDDKMKSTIQQLKAVMRAAPVDSNYADFFAAFEDKNVDKSQRIQKRKEAFELERAKFLQSQRGQPQVSQTNRQSQELQASYDAEQSVQKIVTVPRITKENMPVNDDLLKKIVPKKNLVVLIGCLNSLNIGRNHEKVTDYYSEIFKASNNEDTAFIIVEPRLFDGNKYTNPLDSDKAINLINNIATNSLPSCDCLTIVDLMDNEFIAKVIMESQAENIHVYNDAQFVGEECLNQIPQTLETALTEKANTATCVNLTIAQEVICTNAVENGATKMLLPGIHLSSSQNQSMSEQFERLKRVMTQYGNLTLIRNANKKTELAEFLRKENEGTTLPIFDTWLSGNMTMPTIEYNGAIKPQLMQGIVPNKNHVINPTDSSAQASGSSPEIVITAQEVENLVVTLAGRGEEVNTILDHFYGDNGWNLARLYELKTLLPAGISGTINKLINIQKQKRQNITSRLLEKYEAPAVTSKVHQSIPPHMPLVKEEPVKEVVPSQDILITPEEMGVFINYLAEMGDDSPYLELWYNQEVGLSLIQLRDLHSRANNSSIKSIIGKLIAVCEQEKLSTISDDWVTKKAEVNMPMREEQKNKIHFAELVLNNASDHELNQQLADMDIKDVKAQNGLLLDMNGAGLGRVKLLTRGGGTCGLRALLAGGLTHAVQTGDAQVLDKILVACNGLSDSTDPKYAELQRTLQGQEENIKQYLAAIKNGKKSIKDILKQACIDGHQGCLPDNPLNNALVATVLYAGEEGKAQSEIWLNAIEMSRDIHDGLGATFLSPNKRNDYSAFEVLLCSEALGTKANLVDQYNTCNENAKGELKGNIKIAGAEGHYTFEVSDIIGQDLDETYMNIKNVQQPASPLPLQAMKFSSKASAQKHSVRDEPSEQDRDKSSENNMVQNKPQKNGDIGYTHEDLMSFAVRASCDFNYKQMVEEYLLGSGLTAYQLRTLYFRFENDNKMKSTIQRLEAAYHQVMRAAPVDSNYADFFAAFEDESVDKDQRIQERKEAFELERDKFWQSQRRQPQVSQTNRQSQELQASYDAEQSVQKTVNLNASSEGIASQSDHNSYGSAKNSTQASENAQQAVTPIIQVAPLQVQPVVLNQLNPQALENVQENVSNVLERYQAPAVTPRVNQSKPPQRPLVKEELRKHVSPSNQAPVVDESKLKLSKLKDDVVELFRWSMDLGRLDKQGESGKKKSASIHKSIQNISLAGDINTVIVAVCQTLRLAGQSRGFFGHGYTTTLSKLKQDGAITQLGALLKTADKSFDVSLLNRVNDRKLPRALTELGVKSAKKFQKESPGLSK